MLILIQTKDNQTLNDNTTAHHWWLHDTTNKNAERYIRNRIIDH
jgi:hypothetical protein